MRAFRNINAYSLLLVSAGSNVHVLKIQGSLNKLNVFAYPPSAFESSAFGTAHYVG